MKLSYYRNKADRAMQEWGRRTYKICEVCGAPMSCLHHYWPKSKASALRYEPDNLIPLCAGCHLKHHTGDPSIHNAIRDKRDSLWLDWLNNVKEQIIKPTKAYYEDIVEMFSAKER